jgi:glycosyltransferase involved in cell wall biosynthesis
MSNGRYLYIGAKANFGDIHPGGQSTASQGLIEFCEDQKIQLEIINSLQESFPFPSFWTRVKRMLSRQNQLFMKLIKTEYDGVIIFSSSGLSFYEKSYFAMICRCFGVESIMFVRSGHFVTDCENSKIKRLINKLLLKIPNWIAAQGTSWVSLYQELGVDVSRVVLVRNWIPPGFSIASRKKHLSKEGGEIVTFIFVGWLVKEKGVGELLEAICSSEILRNCRVVFAGNGTLYEEICDTKERENLDKVQVLGWQSVAEVNLLLEDAHVFVLPSYAEGFPNALMEAISKGLPAVVTPVGGITDSALNGVNSILVKPKDVKSLREAMEKFALEPELIAEYSTKSIGIAHKNHDRETNCRELFQCFTKAPCFDAPAKGPLA